MSTETITIEVDGRTLEARKGQMLIEVTDAADIYVPRFCWHRKLSVAANCRMCLVDVERAPKPLPACATPVMPGMKVQTRSPRAIDAQKATMEFLLINHPLDCPICDQGGECELQDLAMGYGSAVSRYTERKRVVKDKDIGPLIRTDMTRCIHCTRCVRFGEEIAGLRELGATGRGEHMEIGTYVAHAVSSELSGNVIDLCPVGALTSRPYRYSARAWELRSRDGIAMHDGVGSNLHHHVKGAVVKRVVPRENEAVNEVWISDRDRYSYEGLRAADRLTVPLVRGPDGWREVDLAGALAVAAEGLRAAIAAAGPDGFAALASPSCSVEEFHLLQKLARAQGSEHVDHRLHLRAAGDGTGDALWPTLGASLVELEQLDAALLIDCNPRHEAPLVNHRLRKAAMRGARLHRVGAVAWESSWPVAVDVLAAPSGLTRVLAGVARALVDAGSVAPAGLSERLAGVVPEPAERALAAGLRAGGHRLVLLGARALAARDAEAVQHWARAVARLADAPLGVLAPGGNAQGAWLAGALPHRGPGGEARRTPGLALPALLAAPRSAHLLLDVEPEDCADPVAVTAALGAARCNVVLTPWRTPALEAVAHVLLPIAIHAENEGTWVNLEGRWQGQVAAVTPPGEARPAWKLLRVLGQSMGVQGFAHETVADVTAEARAAIDAATPAAPAEVLPELPTATASLAGVLEVVAETPMYRSDGVVRRAPALAQAGHSGDDLARLHPQTAASLGLLAGRGLVLSGEGREARLDWTEDARIAPGAVHLWATRAATAALTGLAQVAVGQPDAPA